MTAGWPRDGGCRCGRLRFRVIAPPILTMVCHCAGCQRMTGGPFSWSAAFRPSDFEILQGEPVIGGLHGEIRHQFCAHCMSWVFTQPPGDSIVNVRAPMLDDASDLEPFMETCAAEKLDWVTTPVVRSFPVFPGLDDWFELTAAYAAR